jgi:hypothetical protein
MGNRATVGMPFSSEARNSSSQKQVAKPAFPLTWRRQLQRSCGGEAEVIGSTSSLEAAGTTRVREPRAFVHFLSIPEKTQKYKMPAIPK